MPLRKRVALKRNALYLLSSAVILIIGILAYLYINNTTNTQEYARLVTRAQSMAALIDPSELSTLSLSNADLTNPAYIDLKHKMIALKEVNPDLRFVYLMASRDDHVYFIVDSEDPASDGYSPPGQEYTEASPALKHEWSPKVPYVLEIYADRWGDWISGLAPIINASGTTVALLGLDQNARSHQLVFLTETGLVVFGVIALLALIGMLYVLSKREQDFADMKTDFVAIASHELRSPLASVRWSLSELRANPALSQDARTIVNDLYTRICALIERTSTFLLTTAADHGVMNKEDLKPMNISPVIAKSVAHAETLAVPKKIRIVHDAAFDSSIVVRGDAERLQLVFDNLLSNAVKYSPEGSSVSISYSDRGSTKIFAVHDQGIGIPKAELKAIFGGFYRSANAKRSGSLGSGFGLYIAKKIVAFHSGTLTCESDPVTGTTFSVALPQSV
jgi:signal transduction histidine kinase